MKTVLTPVEWALLQDVVNTAADLEGNERESYLAHACYDQPQLRSRVESLLGAFSTTESTFFSSAISAAASNALDEDLPASGARVGPYRIKSVIGRGGMGVVYEAFRDDDQYRLRVAIKVVASGLFSRTLLQRFRNERQILANLDHPNIARLLDGGATEGGLPYVVMEFVDGIPLTEYCQKYELTINQKLMLMVRVAKAVQYAHQKLVVHRDLKPGNILVTESAEPKLLDFGIAKLLDLDSEYPPEALTTGAGRLMTPEYASPEQIRGDAITTATDVYQMGAMLFEMLSGELPFKASKSGPRLELQICERQPPRPGINNDLDRVILKSLEKDPARRYASAADFAADIQRYLHGYPVQARPASWSYITWRFVRRHRLGAVAVLLFFLLVSAATIEMAVLTRRARNEANTANQVTDFVVGVFDSNDPRNGRGDQTTARELLDRAVPRIDNTLKDAPEVRARLLDTMGGIYTRLGDYKEADHLLSQSITIRKRVLGREDMDLVDSMANLADNAANLGDYGYSESLYRDCIRISRKVMGDNDDTEAASISNLGSVLADEGKYQEAERLDEQAVAMRKRNLGVNAPKTLISMNNLQSTYTSEGKYRQSEALAREILARRQSFEKEWNPDLAYSWGNLGGVLCSMAQYPEAEAAAWKSLEIRLKAYPPKHPEIEWGRVMLARVLNAAGKPVEAKNLAQKALDELAAAGNKNPALVPFAQRMLGEALLTIGEPTRARELFEDALVMDEKSVRADSAKLGNDWVRLAEADRALRHYPLAKTEAERAVSMTAKALGVTHVTFADAETVLAEVEVGQGNWNLAQLAARRALTIELAIFSPPNPAISRTQSVLGWALWKQGRDEDTALLLEQAYKTDNQIFRGVTGTRASAEVAARWGAFVHATHH